jgi:ppGpp synthetase/RelA/SpoT-type nucleotidyltranferase
MPTYNRIDHELELSIRRGFSADLAKYKAIKGWLDGAFRQMVMHKEEMYSFTSRVKQVESLLKKFDDKITNDPISPESNWKDIESYDELTKHIDDIIGGRLITFFVNDIPDLIQYLSDFKRFCLKEVTIHDMADSPILYENALRKLDIPEQVKSQVRDRLQSNRLAGFDVPQKMHNHPDCDSDKIPFEVRLNTNGYVGVHLIIAPLPYDDYYKNEPLLFNKFELQVRSLIHEAWSEIQHKVIYKGARLPDQVKVARSTQFKTLSSILSSCEDGLFDAAYPDGKKS